MPKSNKSAEPSKPEEKTKPKAAASKPAPKAKAAPALKAAAKKPASKLATPGKAEAPAKNPAVKAPAASRKKPAVATSDAPREAMLALETENRELPHEYGDTKIVLMTRDPEWMFVYWEISQAARRKFGIERGRHTRPLVLRVSERVSGNGYAPSYDVEINDHATSSWYLRIKSPLAAVRVSVGIYDEKAGFREIATSREVQLPRLGLAEESDIEFAEINDEVYGQIVKLSGGAHVADRPSAPGDDFLRGVQQRIIQTLYEGPFSSGGGLSSGALYSSGSFFGLSSGLLGGSSSFMLPSSFASAAGGEESLKRPKGNSTDFWLEVGVDVIVYGATRPDAKVRFMGQDINLTPDGTFRIRMVLPDTSVEFPVEATSADGKELRKVKPVVRRHTEGDPHKPA